MASGAPSVRDFIGIGSTIAVLVAGGLVLGWFADKQMTTLPLFTLVGLLLGIVAASIYLYRVYLRFSKE
jgi:F0F1-type ATP synthase assembly protein I